MLAVNVVIIFSALGSAVVLAYTRETVSTIPRIGFGASLSTPEEEQNVEGVPIQPALNFLLVGVDSIGNLPNDHPLRVSRDLTTLTDTMIILRVEPETGDAYAISIPRDLWVPIAEPVGYAAALGVLRVHVQDAAIAAGHQRRDVVHPRVARPQVTAPD